VEDAPDHPALPHRLAWARHVSRLREAPTHLAKAQPLASHPLKHLAHYTGFVRDPLIAGLASPCMLVDIALAIGCATEHMHDTRTGRMSFAPAVAFDPLGPLVLGHHALHLEQAGGFRAAPQCAVSEHHRTTHPLACIH
jgi:hypothetical protein